MRIFCPKEINPGETRIALLPENAKKLADLGIEVCIEAGLGAALGISDQDYQQAGALVETNRSSGLGNADVVFQVGARPADEVSQLKSGAFHVSFLDPFRQQDLVKSLASAGVQAVSMEMMPRTTIAQKMDALSSQASLAGYVAVLLAAERLDRIFPMMMTPAGTLSPARVFVIGVGVAGLQAIATAKRLGARVDAFDTRPVVEEQVRSLGAKFVKIDLGDTSQTDQGYARELTPEQIKRQQDGMAKVCTQSDVVITTAQVFGRPAPRIMTADMVKGMRPGALIVDMAVGTGGNVEGSVSGEEVVVDGVRIIGNANLPGEVAYHASQMYANNLSHFIAHFWDSEAKAFQADPEDEIIQGAVLTRDGEIVNDRVKEAMNQK
jgi:NAD(P) transhydrogenase subunit alpha